MNYGILALIALTVAFTQMWLSTQKGKGTQSTASTVETQPTQQAQASTIQDYIAQAYGQ